MKTKLAKAVALVVALQAGALHALGLGDIAVSSSVNEKFDAEIPIVNARGLDKAQILVSLATSSDFSRADIERPYYLKGLDFEVDSSVAGTVLRVSTNDVILEPYLNFLLEVRWPSGRLLKEYMVLLDLPAYTTAPARAEVNAPQPSGIDNDGSDRQSNAAASKQSLSSRPSSAQSSAPRNSLPIDTAAISSGSYTVQANQTLWDIGKASRVNGESITQAMTRVYNENPSAFVNGDINQLKKGVVLRIPQGVEIPNVAATHQSPSAIQDKHLAELKDANTSLAEASLGQKVSTVDQGLLTLSTSDIEPEAASNSNGFATNASRQDVGVNDMDVNAGNATATKTANANAVVSTTNADIAQLENDLAQSFESLDRAKLENVELEQRVSGIQQQFGDLERLIALKDQELATLRDAITQGAEANGIDTVAAINNTAFSGAVNDTVEHAAPAANLQTNSFFDKLASALSLTGTALLLVIGAIVALVFAAVWWLSTRKQEDEYEATIFEPVQSSGESELALNEQSETLVTSSAQENPASDSFARQVSEAETIVDERVEQERSDVNQELNSLTSVDVDAINSNDAAVATAVDTLDIENTVEVETDLADSDVFLDEFVSEEPLDELDELGLTLDLDADVNEPVENEKGGLQLAYDADAHESQAGVNAESNDEVSNSNSFASEVGTKLDLARAYIDMGDFDGAREILDEVLQEGSDVQRGQASEMLSRIA